MFNFINYIYLQLEYYMYFSDVQINDVETSYNFYVHLKKSKIVNTQSEQREYTLISHIFVLFLFLCLSQTNKIRKICIDHKILYAVCPTRASSALSVERTTAK